MKIVPATETTHVDKLTTTWAIIEARPTLPALIAVASATEAEQTEPIARGLARVAREAGQRTGYLYLGSRPRATDEQRLAAYADLSISGRPSMRESFDSSLHSWRGSYDVIIVELPELVDCQLGAHVARLAEGVVIGLYPGRRVTQADLDLRTLLDQLSAKILGVVKTSAAATVARTSAVPSRSLTSRFFPVRQP